MEKDNSIKKFKEFLNRYVRLEIIRRKLRREYKRLKRENEKIYLDNLRLTNLLNKNNS